MVTSVTCDSRQGSPIRPSWAIVWGVASLRPISWLAIGGLMVLAFALACAYAPNPLARTALGDLVPLFLLAFTFLLSVKNARASRGHVRLFWSLMAAGLLMWSFSQACWTWYEVVMRKPVPDPNPGDIVLFLHVVPLMAAVGLRPHDAGENEGILVSGLNVLLLLVWWLTVYSLYVFPDEYIVTNLKVYNVRWDRLYTVEGLLLIGVSASSYFTSSGAWKRLYGSIALASGAYFATSMAMNAAITRGTYETGGPYDVLFVGSLSGFLSVAFIGRRLLSSVQSLHPLPQGHRSWAPLLAQFALLSLPVIAFNILYLGSDVPFLRHIRFEVTMAGVIVMAIIVFLKQYLLDRRLLGLLDRSRDTFDNLQRLQGRAVQQAKLASLGELVALAAGELEQPLAAVLDHSERMSASVNLSPEQLAITQKIGQQARRTRELVQGLLSFARQTPGEKTPLDLKPLLQRAIQMEGFKLENRNIKVSVESIDPVPRILGNSNQLLQAFVQIVENAMDALHEVGGGRFQVSLWSVDHEVVIQFADSGSGLRNPERVFDPFYTTKPVGKGTGLGLSATYGVVRDHNGQITCFNRPEGGAAFEIRLPALREELAISSAATA